jgi:L-asparaginase II
MSSQTIVIEVRRGGLTESIHRVHAVVCDADGKVVAVWGDPQHPTFPRSAVKPVQALPLLETGAAAAFGLGGEEIALACASHSGETMHVERVRSWLGRIGLTESDLECGAPTATPGPLHNNCSGKHAGFLTVARHLGLPTRGYVGHDHPVQRLVSAAVVELAGCGAAPWAVDGCSIPTYRLPLAAIATAMARLASPAPHRAAAAATIVASMLAHPQLVAGSHRFDTQFMDTVHRIAVKGGAEGVHAAILPSRGLGVAVKVEDGAGRASEPALLTVLDRLGEVTEMEKAALAGRFILVNAAGLAVGEIRTPPG